MKTIKIEKVNKVNSIKYEKFKQRLLINTCSFCNMMCQKYAKAINLNINEYNCTKASFSVYENIDADEIINKVFELNMKIKNEEITTMDIVEEYSKLFNTCTRLINYDAIECFNCDKLIGGIF